MNEKLEKLKDLIELLEKGELFVENSDSFNITDESIKINKIIIDININNKNQKIELYESMLFPQSLLRGYAYSILLREKVRIKNVLIKIYKTIKMKEVEVEN